MITCCSVSLCQFSSYHYWNPVTICPVLAYLYPRWRSKVFLLFFSHIVLKLIYECINNNRVDWNFKKKSFIFHYPTFWTERVRGKEEVDGQLANDQSHWRQKEADHCFCPFPGTVCLGVFTYVAATLNYIKWTVFVSIVVLKSFPFAKHKKFAGFTPIDLYHRLFY